MRHFLGSKKTNIGFWKALDRGRHRNVAWITGHRDMSTFNQLYDNVKHLKNCTFFTDPWDAFSNVLPKDRVTLSEKSIPFLSSVITHAWFWTPFCISRMLLCTHNRGIDHHPFHICIFSQCVENYLPHTLVCPAFKALMNALSLPVLPGEKAPWPPVAPYPKHTFNKPQGALRSQKTQANYQLFNPTHHLFNTSYTT